MKFKSLFTPMKIGNIEVKNRIVMTAMGVHHKELTNPDGGYTQRGIDYFVERAKGGVGLIVTGAMQVQNHFETDGQATTISSAGESYIKSMRILTDRVHKYGCKIVTQLTAGTGRQAPFWLSDNSDPIAPSDGLPNVWNPQIKHRALTIDEIRNYYVEGFRKGASVVKDAGFDGIEIHAIHEGYLLDQFAIKNMNTRNDEFGGTVENRLRFCKEIIDAIHGEVGEDFPVLMRYSVTSKMKNYNDGALPGEKYTEFGRDYNDSIQVAKYLEQIGYAALDADNGTYDSWFWPHPPVYMPNYCNLDDCAFIKQHVSIPVICAGKMEEPEVCDKAIAEGKIDGVGMARILLADPYWPKKAKENRIDDIKHCIGCHTGCLGKLFLGQRMGCAINPQCCSEKELELKPAEQKKYIMIIGGGIAGMEAAKDLAIRGHNVELYEASDRLGGAFIPASNMSFKKTDQKLINWYEREVHKYTNLHVYMNTMVSKELVSEKKPDEIIVAVGAVTRKLSGVEGIEKTKIAYAKDVLTGKETVGQKVVIIGGGLTGIEMAYDLVLSGKEVSVIEMKDKILDMRDLCAANSQMLNQIIKYHHIPIYTSAQITGVSQDSISFVINGEIKTLNCDTIIASIGYIADTELYHQLEESYGEHIHLIGDSAKVSNLLNATWSAAELAVSL